MDHNKFQRKYLFDYKSLYCLMKIDIVLNASFEELNDSTNKPTVQDIITTLKSTNQNLTSIQAILRIKEPLFLNLSVSHQISNIG